MGRCFPKLIQNKVDIELGNGETIRCEMLPVSDLDKLYEISDLLSKGEKEEYEKAHKGLLELASKALPQYSDNLRRFSVVMLSELVSFLMFGDDSKGDVDGAKKNVE